MNTAHALFPVKLLDILRMYENSKQGIQCINAAVTLSGVKSPEDGFTRALMSSPSLFAVVNDNAVQRMRLAFEPNTYRNAYKTKLELYSGNGELLETVQHTKWSMPLSLAIEVELLERILNINPL